MTGGARWRLALIAAAAAVLAAPFGIERVRDRTPSPEPTGPPSLAISSPAEGAQIAGNVVELLVDARAVPAGARYAAIADRDAPAAGAPIPRTKGVAFSSRPVVAVGGLAPGAHRINVVLVDANGARAGDAIAMRTVRTSGPALTATAPATAIEGEPWTITISSPGIAIAQGGSHYHLLIDQELPPPGVAIPEDAENVVHTTVARVPLAGLEAGDHHVWVVAGDAEHRPLAPFAADLVYVRITA